MACNQKFADAIIQNYQEGDIGMLLESGEYVDTEYTLQCGVSASSCSIPYLPTFDTVNDYHLMLVPALVRAALPSAAIGFFLHVAFPSSEIFRCLAVREKLCV